MKASVVFGAIFILAAFTLPMIALFKNNQNVSYDQVSIQQDIPASITENPLVPDTAPDSSPESSGQDNHDESYYESPPEDPKPANDTFGQLSSYGVKSFKILNSSTGKVEEVSVRDYVRGAVASEMPAKFHEEALKAQAVAAHTYALYNHYFQQNNPDPSLKGADFAADPLNRKGYMTEKAVKDFYGESAEISWRKICNAVDSVLAYIIEYDNEPIVAAYHSISSGKTEDAANVWQGSAPYLIAEESEGCLLAPDYEVTTTISAPNAKLIIKENYPQANLESDPAAWFNIQERSDSGYVTQIDVGGISLHGKDVRSMFDLRSHDFDISCSGDIFSFTTYGYGHGVGLSQYGADFMARQGASFDEILDNYYSGIVIKQIDTDLLTD